MVIWYLKQIGKVKKFGEWVPHELTEIKKKNVVLKCHLLLFYATTNHFSDCDVQWKVHFTWQPVAINSVIWPPHAKSWLLGKDSDAGRDWGQEEKGTTEDKMAGWHHWLDGCESQWTPGVGDGQGGLACCDLWGRKESDMTERLIWSDLIRKNKKWA